MVDVLVWMDGWNDLPFKEGQASSSVSNLFLFQLLLPY